jgi:hypothetical protein
MASSINASVSGAGGVITTADNTGTLNLQSGGTTIATINSTGLSMASGKLLAPTGPAFSAERASSQTFTQNTFTKVLCQTENFDTNSNYDNSTNYRFTPTVAGYYQFNGTLTIISTSTNNRQILAFFKNNSQALRPVDLYTSPGSATTMFNGSGLIYMNGSTDYVELFVYVTGAGTLSVAANGAGELSTFSGFLARAA